jgi:hypothetical protein
MPYHGGMTRALAWSPDGEHVVHDVSGPAGTWICLRTADGDVIQEWNFSLVVRANPAFARWAPGGQSVVLGAIDGRGRGGFFRIDLESGELDLVRQFEHQGLFGQSFSFSPDGRSIYFTGVAEGGHEEERSVPAEGTVEIVMHDLETGREHAVHPVRHPGPVVPSPDGAVRAYHAVGENADRTIQLFPADGSEPRTVHRMRDPSEPSGIVGWTPDSRFVLFLVQPDSAELELWRVSRDGEETEMITAIPDYAGGWDLQRDGRTLAYRAGTWRSEIWGLEGAAGAPTLTQRAR